MKKLKFYLFIVSLLFYYIPLNQNNMSTTIIFICKKPNPLIFVDGVMNLSASCEAPDDCTLNNSMCKKKKAEEIYAVPAFFCTS